MDLEDQIAKIIKDVYASTGFEDEGRSTAAAHNIMNLLKETEGVNLHCSFPYCGD